MNKIKVGIVEDELIIGLGITNALKELGYDVTEPAINYTEALKMVQDEKPDLLLLDIMLSGNKDGIDVAAEVRKMINIPIIFLTANTDAATVARAKHVAPNAYLVKPFRKNDLYTSIEVCLHNFAHLNKPNELKTDNNLIINDALFIKQGHFFHKVKTEDILYLESDNNYVNVYTAKSKMLVRNTLPDYLELLNSKLFYRIHRSYAVNVHHIQSINSEFLLVNNTELPLSKTYRDNLLSVLKLG